MSQQCWHRGEANQQEQPALDSSWGCLDEFANLRLTLGRLLQSSEIDGLKHDEDIAMRCAFYAYGNPTPAELEEAYAKEPKYLLNYALDNEAIWRGEETRETLRTLSWAASLSESYADLTFPNSFNYRREQFGTKHPEWFRKGEIDSGHAEFQAEVVEMVKSLNVMRESQTDMHNHITRVLASLQTRMMIGFWIGCVVLAWVLFGR